MNGKSYFLAASALCGLGTLTGCDFGLLPPNIRYVEELAKIEKERLDAHDKSVTEQHKIQTPEVAAELEAQRTLFTQRMAALDEDLAKARAEQEGAWQEIIKIGAGLAGVPAIVTDKLMPKIESAKTEAGEAKIAATLVGAKADQMEKALARLSEETRDKLAKLEGFDMAKFDEEVEKAVKNYSVLSGQELKDRVINDLRDAGLSPEKLRELEQYSPTEIAGMVGGGGGGIIGLLAMLRTFGPSRSKTQTDILDSHFQELKKEVDHLRGGQVMANAGPTSTSKPPSATGAG